MDFFAKLLILYVTIGQVMAFRMSQPQFSSLKKTSLHSTPAAGFSSHSAVDEIPETLVKAIDGNASMRKKIESLCRNAQVNLNTILLLQKILPSFHFKFRPKFAKPLKIPTEKASSALMLGFARVVEVGSLVC